MTVINGKSKIEAACETCKWTNTDLLTAETEGIIHAFVNNHNVKVSIYTSSRYICRKIKP